MSIIMRNADSTLVMTHLLTFSHASIVPTYGSIAGSNIYFSSMLHGQKWEYLSYDHKRRALVTATKAIDQLNFAGTRYDVLQALQFPRGTDTVVPVAIEEATYELALAFLKGVDPDTERDNLSMVVQAYGSVRAEWDRTSPPAHIVAGIPSARAWALLLPFLQPRLAVRISRTD